MADDGDHDLESLRISQREARTVLDHQINTFTEVDQKAAETTRLVALLLGLILTAASIIAQSDLSLNPYLNWGTFLGLVSLIIAFIFSVITYTSTDIETGIGKPDIDRLIDRKYTETDWLILLLRSEGEWMKTNEKRLTRNNRWLFAAHVSLVIGIVLVVGGIVGGLLDLAVL
jgi:hypothetical protein